MVSKCENGGQIGQDKTGQVAMFASFTAKPRAVVNILMSNIKPGFTGFSNGQQ